MDETDPTMPLLGLPMRKLSDELWVEAWEGATVQAAVYKDDAVWLAHFWVYRGHGKGELLQVVQKRDRVRSADAARQHLDRVMSLVRDAFTNLKVRQEASVA
ncbi:MAG TPA: hypothetical protein VJN18_32340 [Polyangiaceae bacterium]|nr:hypothetical protein [Polyangiaceae bacterium]